MRQPVPPRSSSRPGSRSTARWRLRVLVRLRRLVMICCGCILMALGIVLVPSPLPVGFVLFAVGLFLTARASRWVRRLVRQGRRMLPAFSRGLNRLKHRLPGPMRAFIEQSDPGE
ncbi:MAG: PGPGW domain-containing protein [Rhodospirillaceae bacterium]|nr:PGPGW domain-containing protein [Rhodospirillaceae bacterium]